MKKSFSLIELIIVIIVVGILYSSINYSLADTSLNQAADQLIYHINYTRHLAINDNKMQYYPLDNSKIEMNRSKYWFKQWWQIRFTRHENNKTHQYYYFYEIFSDLPYSSTTQNFNKKGNTPTNDELRKEGYAINPLNYKYLVGLGYNDDKNFPKNYDPTLDLTKKYNIYKVLINGYDVSYSQGIHRFIFDNEGNIYTDYQKGDAGDINPYDKDIRKPLLKIAKITLCKEDSCENNISICVTPKIGTVYLCK